MSKTRTVATVVCLAGLAIWFGTRPSDGASDGASDGPGDGLTVIPPVGSHGMPVPVLAPRSELPVEGFTKSPPGSRVAVRLPRVDRGIPLGGGVFLPPLNGVKIEDGIPPIRRDPRLPPPGPVVARQVDMSGQEWWVHEDGSQTSCSYASITTDGEDRVIVSTQHGAARPGGHGALPLDNR